MGLLGRRGGSFKGRRAETRGRDAVGLALLVGGCLTLAGCPPRVADEPLKAPTTSDAFPGVVCDALRPQTEPDLMAWDSGSRLKLAKLRDEGVVAVRYQAKGCNVELELLPCVAGGPTSYTFKPYSANEHKVAHSANELFAQLPVGAARLAGSVKGERALRTDYMLAGLYGLPTGQAFKASDLRGPREVCARATHVVSAVYIGAFAMAAGEARTLEASATLMGAGVGDKSRADVQSLGEEGDADACRASQREHKENTGCAVPLRIGLLALERGAAADTGGATAPTPTVTTAPIPTPPATAAAAATSATPAPPPAAPASLDPEAASAFLGHAKRALAAEAAGSFDECVSADRAALAVASSSGTYLHLSSCEARKGALLDALKDAQKGLEVAITQRDAEAMRLGRARVKALLERVPHVTFAVRAGYSLPIVRFDDRAVPSESLSKHFSVDPGEHEVDYRIAPPAGAIEAGRFKVRVAEGESLTITVPPP